jgi:hypothetical protein
VLVSPTSSTIFDLFYGDGGWLRLERDLRHPVARAKYSPEQIATGANLVKLSVEIDLFNVKNAHDRHQ